MWPCKKCTSIDGSQQSKLDINKYVSRILPWQKVKFTWIFFVRKKYRFINSWYLKWFREFKIEKKIQKNTNMHFSTKLFRRKSMSSKRYPISQYIYQNIKLNLIPILFPKSKLRFRLFTMKYKIQTLLRAELSNVHQYWGGMSSSLVLHYSCPLACLVQPGVPHVVVAVDVVV